jgi:hypothetical protein
MSWQQASVLRQGASRPYRMRMCGMEHLSTRPDARLVIAAIGKADLLKFGRITTRMVQVNISGSLFLVAALAAPVTVLAARATQEDHERKRVYDKDHKDYHNWDDNENRARGRFLTENQGISRIREVGQEGAVRTLELAPQPSG